MKRHYYIFILILSVFTACKNEGEMTVGEAITKKMALEFNDISRKNNDWHQFKLASSKDLNVSFSKGKLDGDIYTITAEEYTQDNAPIEIMLSSDKPGTYSFSLTYYKSSESSDSPDFENGQGYKIPELVVQPEWKKYIPWAISLAMVLVLLFLWLLYKHKEKNSFDSGYLQIILPEDKDQINLEGKRKIDLAKALDIEDILCNVYCERDSILEDDQEIEVKTLWIEIDIDMKMTINDIDCHSNVTSLKDEDLVRVFKSQKEIIEFIYNKL